MHSHTAVDFVLPVAAVGASCASYWLGGRRQRSLARRAKAARTPAPTLSLMPGLSIGSAVLSASPGADEGGDIVDVFALDSRFVMMLVADVSGNGVRAAAHTAFVKYTIRTLALESDGDPAVILAKFNAIFARTSTDNEAFVVLILGIIDSQTGDLRYASAGHEPAFIRRRNRRTTLLAPTGPIVGAAPFSAYGSEAVTLDPGDVLVWTTDGMTESRDAKRRLLGVDGLANWIAGATTNVADIADGLIASLRRRSGCAEQDDVAILAVAYDPHSSLVPRAGVASYSFDSKPMQPQNRRCED